MSIAIFILRATVTFLGKLALTKGRFYYLKKVQANENIGNHNFFKMVGDSEVKSNKENQGSI